MFCKKGVITNFSKFTGKHLCRSLFFLIKLQALVLKTPPVAASVFYRMTRLLDIMGLLLTTNELTELKIMSAEFFLISTPYQLSEFKTVAIRASCKNFEYTMLPINCDS